MTNKLPKPPSHPVEPRKLLKNTIWRMDWQHRQLLLYENDNLYILPMRGDIGIKINFMGTPNQVKKFVMLNIISTESIMIPNKRYKSMVPQDTIDRYPILHNILIFTLKIFKKPFDLNERVSAFRYGKADPVNPKLKDKIVFIMQNYK